MLSTYSMSDNIIRVVYTLLTSTLRWTDLLWFHCFIVRIEWLNILWTVKHDWDMDCNYELVYQNGWISLCNAERPMG